MSLFTHRVRLGAQKGLCTPLFHCAGRHVFLNLALLAGRTFILEGGFSARNVPRWLHETKATVFFGVPMMYELLIQQPIFQLTYMPHLRLCTYSAAPMPVSLIERLHLQIHNGCITKLLWTDGKRSMCDDVI